MRRRVFLQALNNIVSNLTSSGIVDMLRRVFESKRMDKEQINHFDYQVFLDYALKASTYGDEERQMLEIMDLDMLADPKWWQSLEALELGQLYPCFDRANFAIRNLPYLAKLLKQDYIEEVGDEHSAPTLSKELRGKSLLNVTLVENHGQFSSPARLVFVLEAINQFYDAIAVLEELPQSDLAVLALDSGSDKSFDFLGLAKVMDSVKELILGIWDRRLFNRHLQVDACVESIAHSLPVIEKIHQMREAGALAPEQAELLKRQIISGTTKFLEAGAVIPEMGDQQGLSPRTLMRPEQKLLAGPAADHSSVTADDGLDHTDSSRSRRSSESEIARLEELLRRAKGQD